MAEQPPLASETPAEAAAPSTTAPASAPTSKTRTILVVGATGKQGHAFIASALSAPDSPFRILALTRSPSSPGAKALLSLARDGEQDRVRLVQADLDKPASVRKVFEDAKAGKREGEEGANGIWGVFVVLTFPGLGADATGEEKQGKLIADLAHEYAVSYFVFSSVERGGESYDDKLELDRAAKVAIERHIKSIDGLQWTILRPAFFMENFDGAIGSITTTVLRVGLKKETRLQLIAAEDIGHVAHAVFQNPSAHVGRAIVVLGDALTTQEMAEAYQRGAGRPLNAVPTFIGKSLLAINKHTKDLIADIERVHAARIDASLPESEKYQGMIEQCRALYPGMQTFEVWAQARGTKKERKKRWNNVTVGELVQGKR